MSAASEGGGGGSMEPRRRGVVETTPRQNDAMERRWQQLTADVCRPEVRDKWWRVIHDALTGGKHKKYIYNLDYLERRLDLCDQHSQLLARPRAVALAVFFTQ